MPMTTTAIKPIPESDVASLAEETELTPTDVEAALQSILAESVLQSFPEDQRLPIAIGIFRSRKMSELLDGGQPYHLHVLTSSAPSRVKPKEGDPFDLASILAIGYSKHPDGSDGPTGIVEVGIFVRPDSPAHMKTLHTQFIPGKTYEVSLATKGKDPDPGQRPYYSLSAVASSKPKEIPTPTGIDAAAFIKKVFPPISLADLAKHATKDAADINNWVSVEAAIISARRGDGKKDGKPYGFYEAIPPGTKLTELKKNPAIKATINVNKTQVQWSIGSKLLFFGPVQGPSDDGKYSASMRARNVYSIIGIPYIQAVERKPSAAASAATEDAADVGDF